MVGRVYTEVQLGVTKKMNERIARGQQEAS